METLVDQPAAVIRRNAVDAIAIGFTPADVRRLADGSEFLLAVAREVEALTARGLTVRHARRAGRDAGPFKPLSAEVAAQAAAVFIADGHSAAAMRGQARREPRWVRPMILAIAAAMDDLTAEGATLAGAMAPVESSEAGQ